MTYADLGLVFNACCAAWCVLATILGYAVSFWLVYWLIRKLCGDYNFDKKLKDVAEHRWLSK